MVQSLILLIGQLYFDFPVTCLELAWICLSNRLEAYWSWDFEHGVAHLAHSSCNCRNHWDPWDPPRNSGPDSNGLHPSIEHNVEHAWNFVDFNGNAKSFCLWLDWLVIGLYWSFGHPKFLSWISGSQFFITLGSGALAHVSSRVLSLLSR